MITRLVVRNFKNLEELDISFENSVVFVGPNNSGKTSALQAIALFELAVKKWIEERVYKNSNARTRTAVGISRDELLSIPNENIKQLWRNLKVRAGDENEEGKKITRNISIHLYAEGNTAGENWKVAFDIDYAAESLMYIRLSLDKLGEEYKFPKILERENISFLYPMSGIKMLEEKLEKGSILRRIGEGDTSGVLRNLCLIISEDSYLWQEFNDNIKNMFGIIINKPYYVPKTSQIYLSYSEKNIKDLDVSNLGSGARQTILIFAYMLAFPSSIILMDEPDAHLEVIRQREIFESLSKFVNKTKGQLFIATHSEAVVDAAFEKNQIIAFLGNNPHVINERSRKYPTASLKEIGYMNYLYAQQKGWVLYVEGETDYLNLKAFASKLNHKSLSLFEQTFYHTVGNQPMKAIGHFRALKEAFPKIGGICIFDSDVDITGKDIPDLKILKWSRNEIENYIPLPTTLFEYSRKLFPGLFAESYINKMKDVVKKRLPPASLNDPEDVFWKNTKMSDNFLDIVLKEYFESISYPIILKKSSYSELIYLSDKDSIPEEVSEKLDNIYEVAQHYSPIIISSAVS